MSTGSSELSFSGGGRTRALTVRRSALARRMTLAVDPRDGTVRLTLPRRAALAPGLRWAQEKRGWIEAALAALPPPQRFGPGATIPFEGRELLVEVRPGPRGVRIEGDRMIVGGPAELAGARALRWLRAEAARVLAEETRAMAAGAGITVGRIGVGDPKSRWGSCSSSGDIRYSWRLILMPPEVRRATIAHELAHRLHMDHSPAFHAAVAQLYGRDPRAERAWLKVHGGRVQAIGRD